MYDQVKDFQKDLVYRAENKWRLDRQWDRHRLEDKEAVKSFLAELCLRYDMPVPPVRFRSNQKTSLYSPSRDDLTFSTDIADDDKYPWAFYKEIVIHEFAHYLHWHRPINPIATDHGPEYASYLLRVVEDELGIPASNELCVALNEEGASFWPELDSQLAV